MSQLNAKTLMLGQNADQSKNFKITVPTPEDGTLTIERADGTDVLVVSASGKVTAPANVQTWQDVSASRTFSTVYTNNTGLPIQVAVSCNTGAGTGVVGFSVGGISVVQVGFGAGDSIGVVAQLTVPVGAQYALNNISGSAPTNIRWCELRN